MDRAGASPLQGLRKRPAGAASHGGGGRGAQLLRRATPAALLCPVASAGLKSDCHGRGQLLMCCCGEIVVVTVIIAAATAIDKMLN